MEDILASVVGQKFDVEQYLDDQVGSEPLPFAGMDKSGSAVCVFHLKNACERGSACPYRHVKGDRTVVCKHWLRGLCKKGDMCEFLHEYDMSKMPECYFYSKYNSCTNKECPFLHIDPESKIRECAWYERGFCRHGPSCRHRHTRRLMCINYLCGFCPDGSACKFVHVRFEIPITSESGGGTGGHAGYGNAMGNKNYNSHIICHACNQSGHKIYQCPNVTPEQKEEIISRNSNNHYNHHHHHNSNNNYQHQFHGSNNNSNNSNNQAHAAAATAAGGGAGGDSGQMHPAPNPAAAAPGVRMPHRPLDQVTCFKCGDKGHYANKCPKGMFAFLSPNLQNMQQQQQQQHGFNRNQPPPSQ